MRIRWLGWAGVEIESGGEALVIDLLEDPSATFAPLGDAAREAEVPELVPPETAGRAVAGLVTHLHRDHADGPALAGALAPDAAIYEPVPFGGGGLENAALAQAEAELDGAARERRKVREWERVTAGPFTLTALPAVDGLGDPQVSWLVEADGRRVLHLGDTVFHGFWWRLAQRHGPFDVVLVPINGAVVQFPHRRPASPLPAALDPEQAAVVGTLLRAGTVVPIHYDGFGIDPWYRPVPDARRRFLDAAASAPYTARPLAVGDQLDIPANMPGS
jgi:L-ascorbate metabolism protein UlaG (beta-lactamase superfamily)